jgi:uncharacterized protein YbgA (DUF1722 family)
MKKKLGNMLTNIKNNDEMIQQKEEYIRLFMTAISVLPKRGSHYMALQNVLREINKKISVSQKKYLQDVLNKYKKGQLSWDVPVNIIKMYLLDLDIPYLSKQSYLNPYPEDLHYIEPA